MRIPINQLPGISPLVIDYFENYEKVAEFYNGNFRDIKVLQTRAQEVRSRKMQLRQLVTVLQEQNQHFGCGCQTMENINRLLDRRACVVVTGQQVGLFAGPLYTIYKALTAIKLAARLNRNCKGCYVPIFWLASDDHDFREVNHIKIINKNNQLTEISYNSEQDGTRIPISALRLTSEISAVISQIRDETHPSEFKEEILGLLYNAYQSNYSFSEAFGKWLMLLFKNFGLILIDTGDLRFKNLGKHVFKKEIVEKSPSSQHAIVTSETLLQRKYHAQIKLQRGLLNLFLVKNNRQILEIKNGAFAIKGPNQIFQTQELLSQLEREPQLFSPNVLLRPIYQDALLPTVAYVAGTSEIAYYAQLKGVYKSYGLTMPIIYPRTSITLIEDKVDKVLAKYGLKVQDFWDDVEVLINDITRAQIPESIEENIGKATTCIEKDLNSIKMKSFRLNQL